MTSLEGPALKLGGQIASAAAKSWLQRRKAGVARSADLVDLAAGELKGPLERRKLENLVQLLPLVRHLKNVTELRVHVLFSEPLTDLDALDGLPHLVRIEAEVAHEATVDLSVLSSHLELTAISLFGPRQVIGEHNLHGLETLVHLSLFRDEPCRCIATDRRACSRHPVQRGRPANRRNHHRLLPPGGGSPALRSGDPRPSSARLPPLRKLTALSAPVDVSPLADLELTIDATNTELIGTEELGPGVRLL
ncbi:hypothetical protein [Amycolatopsis sp. lyj-346]|uniref:NACHT N-terminal Helical domain 1-containing protein n=1 Tax=Amycolatopsis sp. lyj-346 TaxID=2789289 RepID=UPI00397C3742